MIGKEDRFHGESSRADQIIIPKKRIFAGYIDICNCRRVIFKVSQIKAPPQEMTV